MGHESRLAIVKLLQETPGLNGGHIAASLGRTTIDNQSDMLFLKKTKVIRREGERIKARWFAVEGAVVMQQKNGGSRAGNMRGNKNHFGKNLCEYHRAGNPRNGICHRCQTLPDAAQKKMDMQLKRLFPLVFKD